MFIISEETDKRIIERYKNREEVRDIVASENIGKSTLYMILDENKIPRRINKNRHKPQCRHCGVLLPEDAKFCHICGKVVLDKKQIAMNDMEYLKAYARHIPQGSKAEFIERCKAIEDYIKVNGLR